MQAQDYAGAKWAIGIRLPGSTDADIEAAFNRGRILRTHALRPTWHFVTPADIRWLLALTAPRVHAANARTYRKLGLDAATLRRGDSALTRALEGGHHLTRAELRTVLAQRRIATNDERMTFLVMHAELEGLICSGPRHGKRLTYALLEERVRPAKPLSRDEALARLARRFLASRSPATPQDLAKWSGLTVAEARRGLDSVRPKRGEQPGHRSAAPVAHLLSVYDELFSSYRDGSAAIAAGHALRRSGVGEAGLYVVTIDGTVVGRWKPARPRGAVELNLFRRVTPAERHALGTAVDRYRVFASDH